MPIGVVIAKENGHGIAFAGSEFSSSVDGINKRCDVLVGIAIDLFAQVDNFLQCAINEGIEFFRNNEIIYSVWLCCEINFGVILL